MRPPAQRSVCSVTRLVAQLQRVLQQPQLRVGRAAAGNRRAPLRRRRRAHRLARSSASRADRSARRSVAVRYLPHRSSSYDSLRPTRKSLLDQRRSPRGSGLRADARSNACAPALHGEIDVRIRDRTARAAPARARLRCAPSRPAGRGCCASASSTSVVSAGIVERVHQRSSMRVLRGGRRPAGRSSFGGAGGVDGAAGDQQRRAPARSRRLLHDRSPCARRAADARAWSAARWCATRARMLDFVDQFVRGCAVRSAGAR